MIAPVPFAAEIKGLLPPAWRSWFVGVKDALDKAPQRVGAVSLESQGAAIVTIAVPTPRLSAGLYRVTYYTRITRAATTSSSLQIGLGWTDGAVGQSFAATSLVGNTTTTYQTDSLLVRVDDGAVIVYGTNYGSVGGTSMQYRLDICVEKISA